MTKNSHKACLSTAKRKKVFLKVQKTFSSEKVFWSPKALGTKCRYSRRSRGLEREARPRVQKRKGVWGKQEFPPEEKGLGKTPRGVPQAIFRVRCPKNRSNSAQNIKEPRPAKRQDGVVVCCISVVRVDYLGFVQVGVFTGRVRMVGLFLAAVEELHNNRRSNGAAQDEQDNRGEIFG